MAKRNKWEQPPAPPPPLFFGEKERDLVKQLNDELIERIVGQTIAYYPISLEHTNFHPLYGEAIVKSFLPPVRVYVLIEWEGSATTTEDGVIDRKSSLMAHFHKRRLVEDVDLFIREGDYILYGKEFYEIVELMEPRELFGQNNFRFEVSAKCIKAREGVFNAT